MSWQASSWALKQRVGDPVLKILLLAAANYADPDGRCWPKVETLAFDSEVSKRTIQRKLAELQELGFIRVTPRYDQRGKQEASLIELLMEGCQIVTPGICHGEGDNKVSPTESLNNHKNKQIRPAKQDDGYPEEFETIWKAYPRTKGTSKKKAHDLWRMLSDERRDAVKLAVPIYAAQMRREGRPEDKIQHMETWLRGRVYETLVVPPGDTNVVQIPWHKTATREQWLKVLQRYESTSNWSASWGPAPGKEGCGLPEELVAAIPYHLHPDRDRPRSQVGVAETKGPEAV